MTTTLFQEPIRQERHLLLDTCQSSLPPHGDIAFLHLPAAVTMPGEVSILPSIQHHG